MDWNDVRRLARRRSRHLQETDSRILLHWRSEHDQAVQTIKLICCESLGGPQLMMVADVCPLSWLPGGAAQRASRQLKFAALLANQDTWVLRRIVPLAQVSGNDVDGLLDWLVYEANWVRKHGAAHRADARAFPRMA